MIATRRLVAVLAADVVGYSRLVGAHESRTLQRLKAIPNELVDPTIAILHGRLVKTTGDGLLLEFGSVVGITQGKAAARPSPDSRPYPRPRCPI